MISHINFNLIDYICIKFRAMFSNGAIVTRKYLKKSKYKRLLDYERLLLRTLYLEMYKTSWTDYLIFGRHLENLDCDLN